MTKYEYTIVDYFKETLRDGPLEIQVLHGLMSGSAGSYIGLITGLMTGALAPDAIGYEAAPIGLVAGFIVGSAIYVTALAKEDIKRNKEKREKDYLEQKLELERKKSKHDLETKLD
jgi:Na+/glutamate symporter